jgi:hypothetical protein
MRSLVQHAKARSQSGQSGAGPAAVSPSAAAAAAAAGAAVFAGGGPLRRARRNSSPPQASLEPPPPADLVTLRCVPYGAGLPRAGCELTGATRLSAGDARLPADAVPRSCAFHAPSRTAGQVVGDLGLSGCPAPAAATVRARSNQVRALLVRRQDAEALRGQPALKVQRARIGPPTQTKSSPATAALHCLRPSLLTKPPNTTPPTTTPRRPPWPALKPSHPSWSCSSGSPPSTLRCRHTTRSGASAWWAARAAAAAAAAARARWRGPRRTARGAGGRGRQSGVGSRRRRSGGAQPRSLPSAGAGCLAEAPYLSCSWHLNARRGRAALSAHVTVINPTPACPFPVHPSTVQGCLQGDEGAKSRWALPRRVSRSNEQGDTERLLRVRAQEGAVMAAHAPPRGAGSCGGGPARRVLHQMCLDWRCVAGGPPNRHGLGWHTCSAGWGCVRGDARCRSRPGLSGTGRGLWAMGASGACGAWWHRGRAA